MTQVGGELPIYTKLAFKSKSSTGLSSVSLVLKLRPAARSPNDVHLTFFPPSKMALAPKILDHSGLPAALKNLPLTLSPTPVLQLLSHFLLKRCLCVSHLPRTPSSFFETASHYIAKTNMGLAVDPGLV